MAEAEPDLLGRLRGELLDDLDEVARPTHWPSLDAVEAAAEWGELRSWVEELRARFSALDHHVVPRCWWRHNGHVEALVALRDHERASFSDGAAPNAPVEWLRALRDVSALLRAWTGELACGASHQETAARPLPVDEEDWRAALAQDLACRRARDGVAAGEEGTSREEAQMPASSVSRREGR